LGVSYISSEISDLIISIKVKNRLISCDSSLVIGCKSLKLIFLPRNSENRQIICLTNTGALN